MHLRRSGDEKVWLAESDAPFSPPCHHSAPFQDHLLVHRKDTPLKPGSQPHPARDTVKASAARIGSIEKELDAAP